MAGVPGRPKIYHIVHWDKLQSIAQSGELWCDATIKARGIGGTTIGMGHIKQSRLARPVSCHPGLMVGGCVPFYFCPRSVMLFMIAKRNPGLSYDGGQEPIVHLECDLYDAIDWANNQRHRWALALTNAAASYTEFRSTLDGLSDINWDAVGARIWNNCRDEKQAEFLCERAFPWTLVRRIGVHSQSQVGHVSRAILGTVHRPEIAIERNWYYG